MKHTLSIILMIASTALALTACEKKSNTMTQAEVGQWKMQHPFNNLPEGTIIVDDKGVVIYNGQPKKEEANKGYHVEEERKKLLDQTLGIKSK